VAVVVVCVAQSKRRDHAMLTTPRGLHGLDHLDHETFVLEGRREGENVGVDGVREGDNARIEREDARV